MGGLPAGAGALVGQRLGKYELLALLALGGTAEIYLARIDGTGGFEKYVVVKCLHDHLAEDPEFVSMFLDEARLGANLDHSNIVQTLGLGEHEGRYYLVMEYIAGLSLALVGRRAHERVRGGKVPVPIILNVATQACGGLHYAHEKTLGLVHRDISPQNLVITYEGIVKVVDFGIAKAEYRETKTRTGTVKGKFAYMSPEQCQAGDVDRTTDVFALGVIVWELLTGRRLFKRDSTYETYQAVIACNVPPPSSVNHELDPALDELVLRAVVKDRSKRYPTAEAFGEVMIGYLHHRGKPAGAGEIARFFEECFAQEMEDHTLRMRELIEGRQKSLADQKLLQWDSSELDGSASVLQPEDLEEIIEDSTSAEAPLSARAIAASGNVGPVSPGLASRAMTAPEKPSARAKVAPEDDFEGGQTTDVEAQKWPRPGTAGNGEKKPEPPPRQTITPAGLRAGGAPLDPLPGEQVLTPPPTVVPPARRFADAPTVLHAPATPAPTPPPSGRFADAATVIEGQTTPPPGPAPTAPPTGQTQMLEPSDLLDVVALPAVQQVFPENAYYQHVAAGGESRKFPPWMLAVMFVVVLALATGITVALARALS